MLLNVACLRRARGGALRADDHGKDLAKLLIAAALATTLAAVLAVALATGSASAADSGRRRAKVLLAEALA
eukprot:3821313-Alexandrium_andersonii.AAC.1